MEKIEFYFNRELNIDMISETFRKAFKVEFDKEYWCWRFKNNPLGKKIYINYILENNTLAAYYAVSPCMVEIEGRGKFKIALSNMTMTHPDYQGRGYFKKLADALFEQLKRDGFIGVFGFANQNSHYGFKKYLNWKDLSPLNIFKTDQSHFRSNLIKEDKNYSFEESLVNEELIAIAANMRFSTNRINIHRDTDILKWRMLTIPNQKYHVLKVTSGNLVYAEVFYKFYKEDIDILEYFYSPVIEKESLETLGICINYFIKKFGKPVNIWSNVHSEEHLYLEKIGFCETNFITYFGFIPFCDDKEILDYRNWHYRFMDSDVF
ncbi:MAG: GNAT family N-acetyltransferase [Bacteroidales bacterium]